MNAILKLVSVLSIAGATTFSIQSFAADGALNPKTRANLEAAMHGEAFANLKYLAYAEQARKTGQPEIAKIFDENANVEANEHFAREADALGLVKSNEANLLDGMAGEKYENTKMYVNYARQADAVGDKKVAAMFRQIAADEGEHYASYKAAADKLHAGAK
jgi:rubrerythrin